MIGINLHEKVDALKKKKCQQKNCLSSNEDRLEVLVLKSTGKNGLMCTECLLDPELLQQLNPVQKYVLPIRKCMKILSQTYMSLIKSRKSSSWAPNILKAEKKELQTAIASLNQKSIQSTMEIGKFMDDSYKYALEQLKQNNFDAQMAKIADLIDENNEAEQQKMNPFTQIKSVSNNLRKEGQIKYLPMESSKRKNDDILLEYRCKMSKANQFLKQLLEVHHECLKKLIQ